MHSCCGSSWLSDRWLFFLLVFCNISDICIPLSNNPPVLYNEFWHITRDLYGDGDGPRGEDREPRLHRGDNVSEFIKIYIKQTKKRADLKDVKYVILQLWYWCYPPVAHSSLQPGEYWLGGDLNAQSASPSDIGTSAIVTVIGVYAGDI